MQHTAKRTFGYHRSYIFAALSNSSTIIAVAFLIIYEAFLRFEQPTRVQGALVLSLASLGLLGNLTTTGLLARTRKTSLNVRGVFLHAVGDTVSSIAVIISSLVVVFAGYSGLDPVAAVLIGILIMRSAYGLVRDSTNILLEATPRHLQLENIAGTIRSVDGVKRVHDLHVWTLTSGLYALSRPVTIESDRTSE